MAPLKWHGGKYYLADWIISLMPEHVHYVEPYAGGLAVLLAKDPVGVSEVVNDIDGDLMNFWRVLQRPATFDRFKHRVDATPFSQVEWKTAELLRLQSCDSVTQAAAFFVRCRQSRAGKFDEFATLSRNRVRRGMNEQASAWMTAVEGLPAVAARLKRVVVLCDDALKVIRQQDGPKTLFYLDPPYPHNTRVSTADYANEMSIGQHEELLRTINACYGKVMISSYPNELYEDMLAGWRTADKTIDNKASGAKEKPRKTERVWMNF
jgi:DNA adenine methylase